MAGFNVGNMLAGANSGIGQIGNWIQSHPNEMGAMLSFANEMQKRKGYRNMMAPAINYLGGTEVNKQLTPQTPPLATETTTIKKEFVDVNKNGVDDRVEAQEMRSPHENPSAALAAGPQAPVPLTPSFSQGGGNVGTPSPTAVVPTAVPSVQNMNIAPQAPQAAPRGVDSMGAMSMMLGPDFALNVAKQREANRLSQTGYDVQREGHGVQRRGQDVQMRGQDLTYESESAKLPIASLQASAAYLKAQVDRDEYNLKNGLRPFTERKLTAEAAKAEQEVKKAAFEMSPDFITFSGQVKAAEERAKVAATEEEKAKAFDKVVETATKIKTSGALKALGLTDYGQVLRATGISSAGPLDSAIAAAATKYSAERIATGNERLAWANVLSGAQQALAPYEKMTEPLPVGNPMKSLQDMMVASGRVVLRTPENIKKMVYYSAQRDLAIEELRRLGETQGTMPAAARRRPAETKTGEALLYTDKPIVVKGKNIPANSEYKVVGDKVFYRPITK